MTLLYGDDDLSNLGFLNLEGSIHCPEDPGPIRLTASMHCAEETAPDGMLPLQITAPFCCHHAAHRHRRHDG